MVFFALIVKLIIIYSIYFVVYDFKAKESYFRTYIYIYIASSHCMSGNRMEELKPLSMNPAIVKNTNCKICNSSALHM